MESTPELDRALDVHTLADAFSIGLDLADLFGHAGDFCAVWLGTASGAMRDFVLCAEDRGRDIDHLVRYAAIGARLVGADRAVLWHSDDDLHDGPVLALEYFEHRDLLADAGAELVDEIVLGDDELRSMAITTFTDAPGWDDVSGRVPALDEE